jgi:hypothetical protein
MAWGSKQPLYLQPIQHIFGELVNSTHFCDARARFGRISKIPQSRGTTPRPHPILRTSSYAVPSLEHDCTRRAEVADIILQHLLAYIPSMDPRSLIVERSQFRRSISYFSFFCFCMSPIMLKQQSRACWAPFGHKGGLRWASSSGYEHPSLRTKCLARILVHQFLPTQRCSTHHSSNSRFILIVAASTWWCLTTRRYGLESEGST